MAATTFSAQSEDTTICTTRNHHVPQSPDNILSPRQAIFAFIVPLLLNFLQIKYQGKDVSPFETHPKTLVVAISSLFITCVSFDARLRISADLRSSPNYYTFYYFAHSIMVIFGLLSLTSLVSILVPEPICPLLFLLAILFAICQLPLSQMIRMLKWLVAHIINTFNYQPQTNTATTTTGVMGLVSDDHINVAVPI